MKAQRRRSDWWLLLFFVPLVPFTCWRCAQPAAADDEPAPAPRPAAVAASQPEPETAPLEVDAGTSPDAGFDAEAFLRALQRSGYGRPSRDEPDPKLLEEYLQKWRAALAPLLERKKQPVTAVRAEGGKPREADEKAACEPGTRPLMLAQPSTVDHVVVVDTSGSMIPEGLRAASDFIGRLEFTLAQRGAPYRLLVVAEPTRLLLPDAGLALRTIGSHDALEVLMASAVSEAPQWLAMTRDQSELRLLLITDDRPQGNAAEFYAQQLSALLGSRGYTFNVMGGFAAPAVLAPADALAPLRCRDKAAGLRGMDPGLVYQQLAMASGGVRASLCSASARLGLVDALVTDGKLQGGCGWHLGAGEQLIDARAVGKGRSDFLLREYALTQCSGARRGYLLDGPALTLCPDTCAALKDEGFVSVEASVRCSAQ